MSNMLLAQSAVLSDDGVYRYRLDFETGIDGPTVAVGMVNPATADAEKKDHTARKVLGFAGRMRAGRVIIWNPFAYRDKDVRALRDAADPVGPDNDQHIEAILREADIHIVAWGPLAKLPKPLRGRWREVCAIADRVGCQLMCWGTAQDGHPRHPLMLAYATPLVPWARP